MFLLIYLRIFPSLVRTGFILKFQRYGALTRCSASADLSCSDTMSNRLSPNSSRNSCIVDGSICPAIISEKDTYHDPHIEIVTEGKMFFEF